MKRIAITGYLIILFIAGGCSFQTLSVITDYDRDAKFDEYKTFYWSDDFQAENGREDPLFYNTLIKKRLKQAIMNQMSVRGYTLSKNNPDLLVNSHVVVQEKNTSQNNYPGYYPFYYGFYPTYGSTTTTQQREGGVIIELIDKDRHQLIWQGYAPDVLHTQTVDKVAEIKDAVAKIFASYEYRVGEHATGG